VLSGARGEAFLPHPPKNSERRSIKNIVGMLLFKGDGNPLTPSLSLACGGEGKVRGKTLSRWNLNAFLMGRLGESEKGNSEKLATALFFDQRPDPEPQSIQADEPAGILLVINLIFLEGGIITRVKGLLRFSPGYHTIALE